jgi:two-component sensor histidine kinase
MAIGRSTAKNAGQDVDTWPAMEGRLQALFDVNNLLMRQQGGPVLLDELLRLITQPYEQVGGPKVSVSGPRVDLAPDELLALCLSLHELATNAAKYGALSVADGRVDVAWKLREGCVDLRWKERGGPPVSAPSRRGFGSGLIVRSVTHTLGGEGTLNFETDGLQCRLRFSPRLPPQA